MEVVAAAADGTTYRIDKYAQPQQNGSEQNNSFCCLQDGQRVVWCGDGQYKLPDGTIVATVASRLCD
ncbi:hypothetical protein KYC_12883 [Achromobacter arsenitoxydans SY8]|uniref:Uncharacterized protein n=2 Tax=Achromobacter TaxID=222 RepID=H0F6W6_9BURK|nr:hypothetical protein KYC_12883 [Achromobacter arsenitoxydans SY8]